MLEAGPPDLEFLMRLRAEFDDAVDIPGAPLGARRVLRLRSGTFEGPRLSGELEPGGGDWVLLRQDGTAELDIRFTLRTSDSASVYMRSYGIFWRPAPPTSATAGERPHPGQDYFRTAALFEAGDGYSWLNRLVAVGVGQRTASGMVTDLFAVN